MIQKVESSFNYVWYVSKARSFATRFSEYLVVLLVGPLMMGTAFSMIASLSSNSFVAYVQTIPGFTQVFLMIGDSVPYVMIIGVFTFLYYFMPNTKVSVKSALVGGLAGGFMWVTMSVIFTTFIANSFRTFAVYASFGVGIVALLWLYLNWLVLLLGAQLAFYHQNPAFPADRPAGGRTCPTACESVFALNIMALVGKAFRGERPTPHDHGCWHEPEHADDGAGSHHQCARRSGLLVATEAETLVPGREMSRIRLQEILDVVRVQGESGSIAIPAGALRSAFWVASWTAPSTRWWARSHWQISWTTSTSGAERITWQP